MRLLAAFRGGRGWLGGEPVEEIPYTTSRVTQEAMDEGTFDVTRPPILVTSKGLRLLRPEEVDMETQTLRLIPNEQFIAKAPPMRPSVKPPVLGPQRGYGGGTSSSSSRPSAGDGARASGYDVFVKGGGDRCRTHPQGGGIHLGGHLKVGCRCEDFGTYGAADNGAHLKVGCRCEDFGTYGAADNGAKAQAANDRPWNRPGKAPPTMLLRPVGGMMDDQVVFQDSVFWTPEILDAIRDLVEEEALFYKPSRKSDSWDDLSGWADGHRWLVRMHGSERVQRLHPEHRSCPEEISDLEFMVEGQGVAWASADRQRLAAC